MLKAKLQSFKNTKERKMLNEKYKYIYMYIYIYKKPTKFMIDLMRKTI